MFGALERVRVIGFGAFQGGSGIFFGSVLRGIGKPFRVLSVDVNLCMASDPGCDFLVASSIAPNVAATINKLTATFPGPIFAILDSDHTKEHVLAEMLSLRPILGRGDYLIVVDANINGHPVFKSHGPRPYEAIQKYFQLYPNYYNRGATREAKFGFTIAPQ